MFFADEMMLPVCLVSIFVKGSTSCIEDVKKNQEDFLLMFFSFSIYLCGASLSNSHTTYMGLEAF